MSLRPTRWLIELGAVALLEPVFLHVFDDDSHEFEPDKTRALRFASKGEAERFGFDHLDESFRVTEHAAAELVGVTDRDHDHEAESLAS